MSKLFPDTLPSSVFRYLNSLTIYFPENKAASIIVQENMDLAGFHMKDGQTVRKSDGRVLDGRNKDDLVALQTVERNSRKQAADSIFWFQERIGQW